MSVDLMELVKGAVSQQVAGKLGGMFGIEEKKSSSVIESAAGAILGGLMKKASTPQGAQVVFDTAKNQDDSILDKLGDLLGGGQQTEKFQKSGGGILDVVLGGNKAGMIKTIAKVLGFNEGMIGKLLATLAPVIMAVVGRYVKSKALDAAGLGRLLGDQKKTLGKYMPAALTSGLDFSDLLGSASQAAGGAGKAASRAADQAAAQGGGLMKLLIPLVILGLVAFALWKFMQPGKPSTDAPQSPPVVQQSESTIPDLNFADIDIAAIGKTGTELQTGFSEITQGFTGLKDEASANSLVETISGFSGKLDGMGLGDLSGPAKTAATGLIDNFIETIKQLVTDNVPDALQGVVQPAVDNLLEKLKPFAS